MEQVFLFATILAPIITALVELFKRTAKLPKNYVPFISFIIGLVVGVVAYPFTDFDLTMRLWAGGFAGLAGTGLFELVNPRAGVTKGDK